MVEELKERESERERERKREYERERDREDFLPIHCEEPKGEIVTQGRARYAENHLGKISGCLYQ